MSVWLPSLVGLALGMRHALEPDHLAAVSTMATEERSAQHGLRLGVFWGLGHALSLFVVGGTLALSNGHMPLAVGHFLELLVSLVVCAIGLGSIRKALRDGAAGAAQAHRHGPVHHVHAAENAHVHWGRWALSTRPLWVGILHGLAGSGTLTAWVLAELSDDTSRLTYIALFGVGSVLGMGLLTGFAAMPLLRALRSPKLLSRVQLTAGVSSTAVGSWLGWQTIQQVMGVTF